MSNPHDYTVGWICAIHTEYVAALAFLDEKHEGPDCVSPNDNNDYTLGKIGRHNVVIAVLPSGEYGISSAASVARDMLHSFPNVRIGLMVGIGGGAPSSKHDIRLGDVVVGVPNNGKGGVIQYDFGKFIQGQEFQEKGFLNQPPTLLRTAVSGLMAHYETDGNRIRENVKSAIAKKPRLRRKYTRPEATTDRLYRPQVVHHTNSETDCAVICGDDSSNLIERSNRDEEGDDDPAIHYGLIASASTLMCDASVRDKLAKRGILCFETEAAGLMNHFPCLVIRGICDYSDSHKTETWQGYAAMAAAAYTKDLLCRIIPNRVEAEKKISSILSGLLEVTQQHRNIAENHRDIAKDHRDIAEEQRDIIKKQLKTQEDFADERLSEKERKCHQLFRLTSNNTDATYEWYKDRIDERVEDTCLWFLNHKHYQEWLQQESGPLLVTADPGCGKSVLAKYLIDHNLSQVATVCYFFFKDKDQNTFRQALCALLHQLFSQMPSLIKHAMPQYYTNGQALINSTQSLWKILRDATKDPDAGPIIIVLDALDECAESELADLMRAVESQFHGGDSGSNKSKLKYLLTCRPYEQITSQFYSLLRKFPNIRIPGEEESGSISLEVNHVIAHRIEQLSDRKRFSAKIKSYLEKKLQETRHRTYLWVQLVFNYLEENILLKKTPKEIKMVITTHPKNVNEAYEKILSKSEDEYMVRRALSIILAASRPLTLSEMNIAMNINDTTQDNTTYTFDNLDLEDERDFKSRLRSLCGLFISIYHGKAYFLHQTAREFLLADLAPSTTIPSALKWHRSITTRQAHHTLAELCVLYLNLFNSDVGSTTEADGSTSYFTDTNALFKYSTENWGTHFRKAQIDDGATIIPVTLRICDTGSKSYLAWFTNYQKSKHGCPSGNLTDLIMASYYGHRAVVKLLVEKGANIEATDSSGRTSLSWAAENNHEDIVKLLIEKGADIEGGDYDQTPLLVAAKKGHIAIVELLIDEGADAESKDKSGRTLLLLAAERGQEAMTQLLLKKGADVEAKAKKHYRTPLAWAANNGHEAIVELLVENGADIETKDNKCGRTPLSWAAGNGRVAIIKLLVERGADIEAKDKNGWTPLSWAALNNQEATTKLLVEMGADTEVEDGYYRRTPLLLAIDKGHETIIKLLLENGANIEAKNTYGETSLSKAAEWGSETIVQLLVENGADIEAENNSGLTPLLLAAQRKRGAIVKLLVGSGANIKGKDADGRTALYWAAEHGLKDIVKLLVRSGADVEAKDADGRTPLYWAAKHGLEDIVKLLIENGADVEAKDADGRTPLSWATDERHEAIIQLLVENGADVKAKDRKGRTPLYWAANNGHTNIVKLLVENGADVEAKDADGRTPLYWAAKYWFKDIVELLVENGADVKAKEAAEETVSWAAIMRFG